MSEKYPVTVISTLRRHTMKKRNESINLKIIFALFVLLISTAGCQNHSNSDVPVDLPKSIGDFPLKEHWRKDFDSELKAMALGSGALITGIVNDDGAVIQAFDITTGSSLWKSELSGNSTGINIMMVDKSVYVVFASKLAAIDLDTGDLIFETEIGASIIDEIAAFTDKHIFVVQVSEGVYAYDRSTGKPSWHILVGRGNVDVFPDTAHQLVYIIHGEYLKAVNVRDGSLAWQKQIGFHGPVEYYDGFIYYSNSDIKDGLENHLQALSLETKKAHWDFDLNGEIKCIKATSDSIIAITNQAIARLDRLSGEKIWGYYISPDVYCPPVIMGDVIYLKDGSSNQFIAMEQENGDLLGRLDFEDSGGFGYKISKDNLLSSIYPSPILVFYSKNSVYIYK